MKNPWRICHGLSSQMHLIWMIYCASEMKHRNVVGYYLLFVHKCNPGDCSIVGQTILLPIIRCSWQSSVSEEAYIIMSSWDTDVEQTPQILSSFDRKGNGTTHTESHFISVHPNLHEVVPNTDRKLGFGMLRVGLFLS